MNFSLVTTEPPFVIRVDCKSMHHLDTARHGLEGIVYRGTIEIDPVPYIALDLMIPLFPAFEGYAAIDEDRVQILFRHALPPGILESRLPLGPSRRIHTRIDLQQLS